MNDRDKIDALKEMFIGWLQNIQKDLYAKGGFIPPEIIAKAFEELREYYDILDDMPDMDELTKKLLGEE